MGSETPNTPLLHHSNTPFCYSPVPILEVQSLSKSYRQAGGETTVAIGNITCQVEAGEFVSFVGPSGCGKTTLLMSIAGLLAPSSGRVIVNGQGSQRAAAQFGVVVSGVQ